MSLNAGTLLLGSGSSLGTGPLTINAATSMARAAASPPPNNNPIVLNGSFTWTGANGYSWNMGTGAVTLNSNIIGYKLATI